jgi:hypothetical protein
MDLMERDWISLVGSLYVRRWMQEPHMLRKFVVKFWKIMPGEGEEDFRGFGIHPTTIFDPRHANNKT